VTDVGVNVIVFTGAGVDGVVAGYPLNMTDGPEPPIFADKVIRLDDAEPLFEKS
jgi:hypothetical protein